MTALRYVREFSLYDISRLMAANIREEAALKGPKFHALVEWRYDEKGHAESATVTLTDGDE